MRDKRRGAILIVTLWILSILSVLAASMAFRLSLELRLSRYYLDEVRVMALAHAGLFRAQELLSKDADDIDTLFQCGILFPIGEKPSDYFKEVPIGEGAFSVAYEEDGKFFYGPSDEDRKINLNTAGENVLTSVFLVTGGVKDPFAARRLANAVIDWRDADSASSMQQGAEDDYYGSLTNSYACADKPFRSVEELMLVRDMTPELFKKIEKVITIFGDPNGLKINLNTASPTVLEIIGLSVGMERDNAGRLAKRIVQYRAGADGDAGTADDNIFTPSDVASLEVRLPDITVLTQATLIPSFKNFFKSGSSYYRIRVTAGIQGGSFRKALEAVVKKEVNKGHPPLVYFHRD